MGVQVGAQGRYGRLLRLEPLPLLLGDKAVLVAVLHQAPVGVVLPQKEPVLGERGEHAVGLLCAARDQVVNEHADVCLVAAEHERLFALELSCGVYACHDALGGRLLVAACAVDLACQKQPLDGLCFEARPELGGRHEVVLDRVAVAHDLRALHAGDASYHLVLHVTRQAGEQAVAVDLQRVQALGLEEELVLLFVREAQDLDLDRGAVARPQAGGDLAVVERGAVQGGEDDLVRAGRGVGQVAGHLRALDAVGGEAEGPRHGVAVLGFEPVQLERSAVDAWGRVGLEPPQREAGLLEGS